ncbi:LysR family transcriptional regulator [Burkholderia gladioli]|nr:LysR family transcriptional regulator [Burkholderia gladioli]
MVNPCRASRSIMTDLFQKPSWDDLRIVKAIADHGSIVAAAAALGLNHSTISRRLAAVEQALGTVLFDRRRNAYATTAAGSEVVALASRIELDVLSLVRRVSGHVHSHKGILRVTTSDALVLDFVTPIIADFRARHPGVQIEMRVGNKALNLARGDSDIAFRATLTPPENLLGRKVATVAWAIYGRRLDHVGEPLEVEALYQRQWVSYGKELAGLKAFDYVNARVPREQVVFRSDSVAGVVAAIHAGLGIGFLPCMHGDLVSGLVRISPVIPEVHDELWLLTHPDIRKSGRVSAFMRHCADAILRQRDFIEGKGRA